MIRIRCWFIALVILLTSFCVVNRAPRFFMAPVDIEFVRDHVVGLVVTYELTEDRYLEYVELRKKANTKFPVQELIYQDGDYRYAKIMGTGTILSNDYVLTVWHLFQYRHIAVRYWVYAYQEGLSKEVKIVALGDQEKDYGIVQFVSPQGFPGIKIAEDALEMGDKIMWVGHGDCIAFNERFGYAGDLTGYFDPNRHFWLTMWPEGPFISISPAAPGDSGTAIINHEGKISGVIYLGIFTGKLSIGMSQPVTVLREWIIENELEFLLE